MLAQPFPTPSYYPEIEQKIQGFCFRNILLFVLRANVLRSVSGLPVVTEAMDGVGVVQLGPGVRKEVSFLPVPVSC